MGGLWQSYAAKKQSMLTRAKAEGLDSAEYEVKWSSHGCGPDVVPLIIQRGFNRSFCGKNPPFTARAFISLETRHIPRTPRTRGRTQRTPNAFSCAARSRARCARESAMASHLISGSRATVL